MARLPNVLRAVVITVSLAAVLAACENGATPGWEVLFSDSFDRVDTVGQDLGSTDWDVYTDGTVGGGTVMHIGGNVVESHWADGAVGVVAAHTGAVDYSEHLLVSVKMKVNSSAAVPASIGGLIMNLQTSNYATYALQVEDDRLLLYEYNGTGLVGNSTASYTIANNTWYTIELESSGLSITGRLKNADGSSVLATCVYAESGSRTYSDGLLGFFNFTTSDGTIRTDQPVYFEDFSLSVWQ